MAGRMCFTCGTAASQALGYLIVPASISACVTANAARRVALFVFDGDDTRVLTGDEWTEYFDEVLDYRSQDFQMLEEAIKSRVIMDEKLTHHADRYDDWTLKYFDVLRLSRMLYAHIKFSKIAVEALLPGLRPKAFRDTICHQLKSNFKHLRSNAQLFLKHI